MKLLLEVLANSCTRTRRGQAKAMPVPEGAS